MLKLYKNTLLQTSTAKDFLETLQFCVSQCSMVEPLLKAANKYRLKDNFLAKAQFPLQFDPKVSGTYLFGAYKQEAVEDAFRMYYIPKPKGESRLLQSELGHFQQIWAWLPSRLVLIFLMHLSPFNHSPFQTPSFFTPYATKATPCRTSYG